jgi:hypothetical protein
VNLSAAFHPTAISTSTCLGDLGGIRHRRTGAGERRRRRRDLERSLPTSRQERLGSIEAERIGGTFAAKTVSGNITAAGLSGRAAIAETVSGAVALDVELPLPTMHLTTVSGDATVRVPHKCDLDVRLTTTSGQVASSFAEIRSSAQPGSRSADGTIGAGGPRLRAHTVSGHVTLLRRTRTTPVWRGRRDDAGAGTARSARLGEETLSPVFGHGSLASISSDCSTRLRGTYDLIRLLEDRFMGRMRLQRERSTPAGTAGNRVDHP